MMIEGGAYQITCKNATPLFLLRAARFSKFAFSILQFFFRCETIAVRIIVFFIILRCGVKYVAQ